MKYCPVCETDYPDDVSVCPQDGAAVRRPGERQDPLLGRVIKGRYRVERLLGRGGMGSVYLAEQLSVGRKVALKVLRGDFARDDGFVARFRQEAKLVAGLNEKRNPRVTLVHDFDQAEDGSVFIVMEWLEGRLLNAVIQAEGPLPLPRAVRLATQIAEGLDAAHRADVIHRDVKPQNIMVLDPGDDIKLMDFGIARLRDSGRTSLTRAGTMMGTPDYMAPEQIEGQEITDKTDIYAFGIVFYEMLVGSVPFRASSQAAVLTKQLQEQPVPPSRLRPDIPEDVEAIILSALEKDAARRPRSMGEIVRALHAVSHRLADGGAAGSSLGEPTIFVDSRPARPVQTAAVTEQLSPGSTLAEPRAPLEPAVGMTLVEAEALERAAPRAPARRAALPWKGILVGGGAAMALAAAVGLVVYLVSVPPPTPPPVASTPAATATQIPSSASTAPPPSVEIVPPRPPEPITPPATVTPPKPAPPPEAKPSPAAVKARPAPRPPVPAPNPRIETKPPLAVSKPVPAPTGPESLRAQVEDRLRSRGLLRGSGPDPETGLSVEVGPNGVVTLRGIVRDAAQRDEAARLARIAGVSEVRLRINVQSSWN